ncbi:MAG: histidinol-phosphate transaminase [Flavobacteriales bacterium]|nr:histidinol-phosphate transaminase [Flavobacteriales bacterium]
MFDLDKIVRSNIKAVTAYSSARDEFSGEAKIWLDANENALGSATDKNYNRYPDPAQSAIKTRLKAIKGVSEDQIFLGNGSDEAIDLLVRAFCEPGQDNIIILPPTYGMYTVSAAINNVEVKEVPLTDSFELDTEKIIDSIDSKTKLLFVCSPNNPTGNCLAKESIKILLNNFNGLVVIDEAYIDFEEDKSWLKELDAYSNLVIMQTFSKAWGLAGIRLGMAFASEEIIDILNRIKPPYNINQVTQDIALDALSEVNIAKKNEMVAFLNAEKLLLGLQLRKISQVQKVYPSDSNFLLVKMYNAKLIYDQLVSNEIVVRDRSKVLLCDNCLRITIGTEEENEALINALENIIS